MSGERLGVAVCEAVISIPNEMTILCIHVADVQVRECDENYGVFPNMEPESGSTTEWEAATGIRAN